VTVNSMGLLQGKWHCAPPLASWELEDLSGAK
jgi:hypothetical protein